MQAFAPAAAEPAHATPQLAPQQRAAKLAQRDRLWKEAGELPSAGKFAEAVERLEANIPIQRELFGPNTIGEAQALERVAFNREMGDYARAEPLSKQASEILRKALGESHPQYATSLLNLGLLKLDLGHLAEAEKLLRQAVQIQRKSLDLTAAVQSEQQELTMTGQMRVYLDNYLSGALVAGVEASEIYAEVAAWKGSISAQQQLLRARQRARAADPNSQVGRVLARLDTDSRRLAALSHVTPQPADAAKIQQELAQLSESVNSLQQELSQLDDDFRHVCAARKIAPDQLRDALPEGTALVDLLEYWHYLPPAEKGNKGSSQRVRASRLWLIWASQPKCLPLVGFAEIERAEVADGVGPVLAPAHAAAFQPICHSGLARAFDRTGTSFPSRMDAPCGCAAWCGRTVPRRSCWTISGSNFRSDSARSRESAKGSANLPQPRLAKQRLRSCFGRILRKLG